MRSRRPLSRNVSPQAKCGTPSSHEPSSVQRKCCARPWGWCRGVGTAAVGILSAAHRNPSLSISTAALAAAVHSWSGRPRIAVGLTRKQPSEQWSRWRRRWSTPETTSNAGEYKIQEQDPRLAKLYLRNWRTIHEFAKEPASSPKKLRSRAPRRFGDQRGQSRDWRRVDASGERPAGGAGHRTRRLPDRGRPAPP